jgi:hypothetical protein
MKPKTRSTNERNDARYRTPESFDMSDRYRYQGPLGKVVHNGRYFFASKDGLLLGTYNTFEEAMESLVWRERVKVK